MTQRGDKHESAADEYGECQLRGEDSVDLADEGQTDGDGRGADGGAVVEVILEIVGGARLDVGRVDGVGGGPGGEG